MRKLAQTIRFQEGLGRVGAAVWLPCSLRYATLVATKVMELPGDPEDGGTEWWEGK
jgi:hypothetical protein